MNKPTYRLPGHVRPISYDIELHASPAQKEFHGTVLIDMLVLRTAETVTLHARDLTITSAAFHGHAAHDGHGAADQRDAAAAVLLEPAQETVSFTPDEALGPGQHCLRVSFRGQLDAGMHGIYLASDGADRAVCTQCEATDARAIFPCFDEPEFKAQLKWTVHTDAGLVALSNAPLLQHEALGDRQVFHFESTRPVSSYLAALAIGDFESQPEQVVSDVPLRVYATRGKAGQTGFALKFTARLLPWYESYFEYPYPYKKYDQVAVPGFDAGAMENIGLVLFRQSLLLMDPGAASWKQEKMIAKVIAHEFAHMWFGNLVTMRWWDDLWLNEAFAEWMAHKAVDAAEPGYLIWNDFQEDKNRALLDDALPTTHSIWSPVQTPDEAVEMFDTITYQKGCAVMRMLENFLGEAPFRDGLRAYMKEFAESNAAGPDLWQKLSVASGQPVGELMESWIAQAGFPLIAIRQEPAEGDKADGAGEKAGGAKSTETPVTRGSTGIRLCFSQRRFYSSPALMQERNEQEWNVPVVLRYDAGHGTREHRFILRQAEEVVSLPASGAGAGQPGGPGGPGNADGGDLRWLCANAGEVGFYRVSLSPALHKALLSVGVEHLSPVEQMGFIEDQWALLRSGAGEIVPFIEVLGGFAGSTCDHNVLRAVTDRLGTLDLLLRDSGDRKARQALRGWVGRLFAAPLAALGFEVRPGEAQNEIQRRALYITALASLGRAPDVIATAVRYADKEQRDPRTVDANLAGVFVGIAAKFGDQARFDAFVQTYQRRKAAGATPQETLRYLHALPAFRPLPQVQGTLRLLSDGTVPQESIGTMLSQMLQGRHGQEAAWVYLKTNWAALRERVGDLGLSRLVESVSGLRAHLRDDIVAFFDKNPPAGAERALSRALAAIDQREELRQRVTPALLDHFLHKNGAEPKAGGSDR